MEKVKVKFVGLYESLIVGPGLHKKVSPGDEVELSKDVFEKEFKGGDVFELAGAAKKKEAPKKEEEKK